MAGQRNNLLTMRKNMCVVWMCLVVFCNVILCKSTVNATTYTSGDYQYTVLEDGTAQLTKYIGSEASVTVPSMIAGYQVSSLYQTFLNSSIESVVISDGIVEIGNGAFKGCSKLKNVEIPDSVKVISPTTLNPYNYGAFTSCSSLESIVIPEGVATLGYDTFCMCSSLEFISLPDSLQEIGNRAFYACTNLRTITIPKGVVTINSKPFSMCTNLSEIQVADDNACFVSVDGVLYTKEQDELVCYPRGKKETTYTVPVVTQNISSFAFEGASNLKEIIIMGTEIYVGDYAFSDCTGLTNIEFLGSGTYVGDGAFYNNANLVQLELPEGITCIYESFGGCDKLSSLTIPASVVSYRVLLGNQPFEDFDEKLTLYIVKDSYAEIFGTLSSVTIAYIETDTVSDSFAYKELADESLQITEYRRNNLMVEIPEYIDGKKVSSIGDGVFRGSNITSVSIPETITYIGHATFADCDGLTTIELPNSVAQIGNSVFYGCNNLQSVVLPNNLNALGEGYTFYGCTSLSSVTLPSSLNKIGNNTFYGCSKLKELIIPEGVTDIGEFSFFNCSSLGSIEIPEKISKIGAYAFGGCSGLTGEVVVSGDITSIEPGSFYDCSNIQKFVVPNTVSCIGTKAFLNCSKLETVVIPKSVLTISNDAFKNDEYAVASTLVLAVEKYSYAEKYAKELGLSYDNNTDIGDIDNTNTEVFGDYIYTCYDESETGWTIVSYTGADEVVDIPDNIKGKPVIAIGDNAFSQCSQMVDVYIPDSVTDIGDNAFYNCTALERVIILSCASWYSIADNAFTGCNDEMIFVVNSTSSIITYINENSLSYCVYEEMNLNEYDFIQLEDGTIQFNGFYIYDTKERTQLVIPDTIDGKEVTVIGNLYINHYMGNTAAVTILIPHTVTQIEETACLGCAGEYVVSKANNNFVVKNKALYDFSMEKLIYVFPIATSTYSVNDGVTYIYAHAFDASQLNEINIPKSVDDLSNGVLSNCYGLTMVNVTESNPYYTSVDGIVFTKDMSELVLCPQKKYITDYSIPEGVTKIGDYAFSNQAYLKTITFPDGITHIGEYAFQHCTNITAIAFPDSVISIERGALYYCNGLAAVTLPSTLTEISKELFYHCSSLKELILPDTITSIGEYAFQYSGITNLIIPNDVATVGVGSFMYCNNLISVTIPESMKTIPNNMFYNCPKLKTVIIPESVSSIGTGAFYFCDILSVVVVPSSVITISSNNFKNCSSAIVLFVDEGSKAETYAVNNNISYEYITESDETVDYEYETLSNETINITKYIGADASVVIPSQINGKIVTEVGANAFSDNTVITDVTLPVSVVALGRQAFSNCTALKEVRCSNTVSTLGTEVFKGCKELEKIALPSALSAISASAFHGCSSLTNVTIGNNVKSIEKYAFADCRALESIELPASVRTIGEYAFLDCLKMEKVSILYKYVYQIPTNAFDGCDSLLEIAIDEGNSNFKNVNGILCKSTTVHICPKGLLTGDFEIPEGIVYVPTKVFSDGKKVTSITIPSTVKSITSDAFLGCNSLTEFIVSEDNEYYVSENGVIYDKEKTTIIAYPNGKAGEYEIPSSITSLKKGTFAKNEKINSVVVPDGITVLPDTLFEGCTSLQNVEIPSTVTAINAKVFAGCKSLGTIYIPETVNDIDITAFENCRDDFTLIVERASYAESFARQNGIAFEYPYIAVSSLTLDKKTLVMKTGDMQVLKATVLPEDATNRVINWSSSDSSIATVSEDGVITAQNAGKVTITASVANENQTVSCAVTVEEASQPYVAVTALTLDKTTFAMKTGEMQALQATVIPENATNKTVQWSSSDTSVATVTDVGVVKALEVGKVTITATTVDGEFVVSCEITIEMSESDTVNIGDEIEDAGMTYKVTSLDSLSVSCIGTTDITATKVTIPDTVSVNGTDYKVEKIVKNAFKGNKKLKSVTIGKEVTSIESQAFYNCKSLKEIIFKTKKLTNIGKKAFKGIAKKAKYSYPSAKKSLYKNLVKLSDKETVQAMSNGIYRISNVKKKTASFIKPASNKVKKISVVATVTINGTKYKVTSIANNAFKHNKKITKVIIGENVSTIGKDAFSYSEKYMYITIRSTKLKKVGKGTLKRGFKLKPPSNKKKKQYEKMFKAAYIG